MSEPIVLVRSDDPEKKPQLYACAKCGQLHSPRIYAARDDVAHAAAKRAASECYTCRTHNVCDSCGAECEKLWTKCAPCRRQAAIDRAAKIPASDVQECFGLDSEQFYTSVEEAEDAGEEWVFAADFRPFQIDPDSVLENLLTDHHEDASEHDLIGWDELEAAIRAFNAKQTSGSYDENRKRIASLAKAEGRHD